MEKIDIVVPACMYNTFLCIYIQSCFIHGLRLLLLIASKLHSHVFFIDDNVIHTYYIYYKRRSSSCLLRKLLCVVVSNNLVIPSCTSGRIKL